MVGSTKEKGVLKLVHPGRHVETYTQPIAAADILRKNPRHSITRPDVFKYPWIVVRPDAVLVPGKVFYIVPNHTIYSLLKGKGYFNPSSPQPKNQSLYQTRFMKSSAGMTPKHQQNDLHLVKQMHGKAQDQESPQEEDEVLESHSFVKNRKTHRKVNKKSPGDSPVSIGCFGSREHRIVARTSISSCPGTENSEQQFKSFEQVNKLKSCLKKQDGARKSRTRIVTFSLPLSPEQNELVDIESDGSIYSL